MEDVEPTNLCVSCRKQFDCNDRGIFERETCDEHEPRQLEDWLKWDKTVRESMVSTCPICFSEHTYDCENNPLLEDITIGHCLDCEAYWCLDCGYIFEVVEKGATCPHFDICDQCPKEQGCLDLGTVIEKECPTCKFYDNGCWLENPADCEHGWAYCCPYDEDFSECPKIEELLQEQM